MVISLELFTMLKTITLLLLCIFILIIDVGQCFRYDRETERSLCRTQCAALCVDDQQHCAQTCSNTTVYRFWITNCDEPYAGCIGTCQILAPSSRILNIFPADYISDESSHYPPIPTCHIAAIQGDSILLTWDVPNDIYKVLYVVQMKTVEDTKWKIFKAAIDDNKLNITVPDICLYQFRIIAINKFGSNGFSHPISVRSVPLEPIHNLTFVGGLYYHEPTGEFMAIISWDDISDLDERVVSHYSWNEMSYVKCPRISQNMQPAFYKFSSKHGRKFILMRVSRDAYGCVFTTQIKAKSVCGGVGGWTNFTIDLSDCNEIHNFPCSAVMPDFSPPGNVGNVSIHVDKGQNPPFICLRWLPPRDLGTAGKLDRYIIRWGKVVQKQPASFLDQPDFVSAPNITQITPISNAFCVEVDYGDLISSIFGFQIIPVAPSQHMSESEYGLFEIFSIESSRVTTNHSGHGHILMDGDNVKIVQVPNSLDVEVAWHLQHPSHWSVNDSLLNENYAVKFGKLVPQDTGPDIVNGNVSMVDASIASITIEITDPGAYNLQIIGLKNDTLPSKDEWLETKIYNFTIKEYGLELSVTEYKDDFRIALEIILPLFIIILLPASIILLRWFVRIHKLNKKMEMESRLGDLTTDFNNDYTNFERHPLTAHYHNRNPESLNLLPTVVPDNWEVPHSCLKVGRVLGSGAFGQVLKGRVSKSVILHRQLRIPRDSNMEGTYISVAVKMLKENAENTHKQDFIKEILLMKSIGFHVNIVAMLGCCTLQDPVCLLVEHLPHGDLRTYLSKIREAIQMREENGDNYINRDADILSPLDLLSFARQIAVGMEFLSDKGFVHRDLAARNVLVGNNKIVKIGDFGLTRFVYNDRVYFNRKGGKFPLKWMSIEAIQELKFSTASDVWSYGIVLFEIVTLGGTPYPTVDPRELLEYLQNGNRMERPDNCSEELYRIMMSCWERCPHNRPNFTTLKEIMEALLLESCGVEYISFMIDQSKYYYNVPGSDENEVANPVPLNETNENSETVVGNHMSQTGTDGNSETVVHNPVSLTGTDGNSETVVGNHVSLAGTDGNSETVVGNHVSLTGTDGNSETVVGNHVSLAGTDGNSETVVGNHVSLTGTDGNSETVVDNPVSLTAADENSEAVVDNPVSLTGTGDNSETVVDNPVSITGPGDNSETVNNPVSLTGTGDNSETVSNPVSLTGTSDNSVSVVASPVILTGEVKHNSTSNIDNSAQSIRKYNNQVNRNITTYESETESPIEKNTQSTHFGFGVISTFEVDDCDYEADDSSLSETSPYRDCPRVSLSSSNEEDEVFKFPNQVPTKRYPKEKHPRFKNRLVHKTTYRQPSSLTDSGISTTSYSESPV